jgi:hypothetical protein
MCGLCDPRDPLSLQLLWIRLEEDSSENPAPLEVKKKSCFESEALLSITVCLRRSVNKIAESTKVSKISQFSQFMFPFKDSQA